MPDGKYSFYLHTDDRADIAAMATISTISQPLRGEFIRTVATAGAVVYRTDARLPELIPVFFDGQFSVVRLYALMAVVSGACASLAGLPDFPDNGAPAVTIPDGSASERRRYTLNLLDDRSGERVEDLLSATSSRLRGQLLRNLIITGTALHTIDPGLPRLLASLPVPPHTVSEFRGLVSQVVQVSLPVDVKAEGKGAEPEERSTGVPVETDTSGIRKNMRRAFGE